MKQQKGQKTIYNKFTYESYMMCIIKLCQSFIYSYNITTKRDKKSVNFKIF